MEIMKFSSGKKDLPRLAILCGVHGSESHAVSQVVDILNFFKSRNEEPEENASDEEIEGHKLVNNLLNKYSEVSFCIGVNELGLEKNVRNFINPDKIEEEVFDRDFNREFDFSKKYDNILEAKKEVLNLILYNDIIIDVHNSPMCENSVVFGLDEKLGSFINVSEKNDISYIVSKNLENGILKNYVNSFDGKSALTVELQGMGIVDFNTRVAAKDFLYKVLNNSEKYLNVEEGIIDNTRIGIEIISPATGILKYAEADPLGYYMSGEKIADVLGLDGSIKAKIKAPVSGKISALCPSLYTKCGAGIATYMPIN